MSIGRNYLDGINRKSLFLLIMSKFHQWYIGKITHQTGYLSGKTKCDTTMRKKYGSQ